VRDEREREREKEITRASVLVDDDGGGGFLLASGLFNKEETDGLLSHTFP
jgi:hypothetical protein